MSASLYSRQGQPLVIVVENVHWIDPSSEAFLAWLADSLSGAYLLLVTTYRPGYSPPWLDKSYATQLSLPRLQSPDSRAVVQSVLSSTPNGCSCEQAIVETAAGNPFFLAELAWAIREGGVQQPTAIIPETVQAVLAARIDRLRPDEKRLSQTAAVIGQEVPLRLLQAIARLPEEVRQRGLIRLQASEFLYETRPSPDFAYTFKHALTHQVAYSTLLQERRCTLHARIVDAIETLYADRLAEQVERLAHHAEQGEMWEKAMVYLRQAGAKAIAGSANREAVAHFERALVVLQHLPQSRTTSEQGIDVRCELRTALVPLNERERIIDILREAQALAQMLDDQRRLGRVSVLISHYLWTGRDLEHALATGHRVLDLAIAAGDMNLKVMAYFVLGEVYYDMGDFRQAMDMLRRNVEALDHADSQERFGEPALGPGLQTVASRRWLIQTLADVGAFAEGIAVATDTIRLAEADGHPYTSVLAYTGVSYLYLCKGEVDKSIPLLERGLDLCRTWDLHQLQGRIEGALGYALALSGQIAEAFAPLQHTVGQDPLCPFDHSPCAHGAMYRVGE